MKGEKSIKKLILIIFSFCFILLCLTGCPLTRSSSLLEAPVFENEEYEIYNTLKNSIYSNSSLFLDIPENKKSAVTFLNNKNSAVLFYNAKEKSNLKMALLNKTDSNWKYVLEVPLGNVKLLDVLVAKNKEENSEFLIVGTKKNKEKIYTIFNVEGKSINKLFSNTYNYMTLFDKQNGEDKTLIVLVDCVSLPKMKKNENIKISENLENEINSFEESLKEYKKTLDPNKQNVKNRTIFLFISLSKNKIKITDFLNTEFSLKEPIYDIYDTKTLNTPALFLSFHQSNFFKTQYAIYYKDNHFKNLDLQRGGSISTVPFLDIYKNGKLKLLESANLQGYNDRYFLLNSKYHEYTPNNPYLSILHSISNENEERTKYIPPIFKNKRSDREFVYINSNHKYGIKFPKNWFPGDFSAKYKNDNQDIDFFLWDDSIEKDSKKFLSISVDYASNENKKNDDCFVLAKKDNLVYYANVYENSKLDNPKYKLTRKQLKDLFFTID